MFRAGKGTRRKSSLGFYYVGTIHLPQRPETSRMLVVQTQTIYINTGADKDANVDRKFQTEKELAYFVGMAQGW